MNNDLNQFVFQNCLNTKKYIYLFELDRRYRSPKKKRFQPNLRWCFRESDVYRFFRSSSWCRNCLWMTIRTLANICKQQSIHLQIRNNIRSGWTRRAPDAQTHKRTHSQRDYIHTTCGASGPRFLLPRQPQLRLKLKNQIKSDINKVLNTGQSILIKFRKLTTPTDRSYIYFLWGCSIWA